MASKRHGMPSPSSIRLRPSTRRQLRILAAVLGLSQDQIISQGIAALADTEHIVIPPASYDRGAKKEKTTW